MRKAPLRRRPRISGRFLAPLPVLLVALLGTACQSTALREAINASFPPVNPVDNQVAAVRASAAELASFQGPSSFYAGLALEDLRRILPSSIATQIKASGGPTIDVTAVDVHLHLGEQEVVVSADFSLKLPGEDASTAGTAEVHCTASIERGSLVLRPSGGSLQLSSLRYHGDKALPIIAPILNGLLRTFLDNINGAIQAQRIPLRFHAMSSIDLAQSLSQTPGVTDATGTVVTAGVALGSSAVLIDRRAVRILGSAVFLTPEAYTKSFALLEARSKSHAVDPLTSEELAVLSACAKPEELARVINAPDSAAVSQACKEAEQSVAEMAPVPVPSTADAGTSLATSFPAYEQAFRQVAQQIEPGTRLLGDGSIVALSRTALAVGLQPTLATARASATYSTSIPPKAFNELVTPTTTNLKCAENAGGCDSDFSYPPYHPRGCDSNCSGIDRKCAFGICVDVPWFDPGCVARKAVCETTKEAERQAYEAAKVAAQVAWSAQKAACELRKAATKAGCDLNQAWLDAWASKEIARVEGSASVPSLRVLAAIDGINLASDFSSLSVQYRLAAEAHVSANAQVTPLNGGHLICAMPANLSLEAQAHVDTLTRSVTASQASVQRDGEDLVLSFDVSGQQIELTFTPALPVALLDQNLDKLALSCPAPAAIVSSIPGFSTALVGLKVLLPIRPDLFASTKAIDIPGRTISVHIPPQEVALDPTGTGKSAKLHLEPEWGQNAVIFSVTK